MSGLDLGAVLAALKPFQRAAVDHVTEQFFGPGADQRSGRFLIADETGLGKSIVARGVVATTIDQLRATTTGPINIIYVCSNQDLAKQNLRRGGDRGRDPALDAGAERGAREPQSVVDRSEPALANPGNVVP